MMTYQDYLDGWEANFGDATTGEYGYLRRGDRYYPFTVHRLSELEFDEHIVALERAGKEFDRAYNLEDNVNMTIILKESMPHELALLL